MYTNGNEVVFDLRFHLSMYSSKLHLSSLLVLCKDPKRMKRCARLDRRKQLASNALIVFGLIILFGGLLLVTRLGVCFGNILWMSEECGLDRPVLVWMEGKYD